MALAFCVAFFCVGKGPRLPPPAWPPAPAEADIMARRQEKKEKEHMHMLQCNGKLRSIHYTFHNHVRPAPHVCGKAFYNLKLAQRCFAPVVRFIRLSEKIITIAIPTRQRTETKRKTKM